MKTKYSGLFSSILILILLFVVSSCAKTPPNENIVFDSGAGTGGEDNMTYAQYESQIIYNPVNNLTVRAINPQINYCNGSCG
jgi:hypothetical protein